MDGYLKLHFFGIEIYAAIDTYSRYIIWSYVGITATTAVSTAVQYLDVLKEVQVLPRVVRTDRGSETVLLAGIQYLLSRTIRGEDILFKECYAYGTSTQNERIEAWWNRLSSGQVLRWRVRTYCRTTRRTANIYLDILSLAKR